MSAVQGPWYEENWVNVATLFLFLYSIFSFFAMLWLYMHHRDTHHSGLQPHQNERQTVPREENIVRDEGHAEPMTRQRWSTPSTQPESTGDASTGGLQGVVIYRNSDMARTRSETEVETNGGSGQLNEIARGRDDSQIDFIRVHTGLGTFGVPILHVPNGHETSNT
ncbi:MAG: hypothetical protein M1812_004736 [Candelaria pacifica]|nr:MAG: hypothetical protein M1812_004736 [Candelaria pacifica]